MNKEKKAKQLSKKEREYLEKEIKECKKLRDEYLAGWQRTKADFLNYQKQGDKRIETFLNSIKIEWILKMLEIHDNLERAKEHIPKKLEGIDWVKGVLQIEMKGKKHGVIVEVLEKGYMLNNRVIRPAKVKIIK